jgi:hypothetical protein
MVRMNHSRAAARLRLPEKLAYTAIRLAVAGTLACSATSDHSPGPADASADRAIDAPRSDAAQYPDAYSDACPIAEQLPCTAVNPGTACPAYVCNPADCPIASGCEPII